MYSMKMGTLVSALGVILSVKIDTPTGATIVITYGGVLALMFFLPDSASWTSPTGP
jgi:ABC-type Mn2+/Zn2+ transport system permease subunit